MRKFLLILITAMLFSCILMSLASCDASGDNPSSEITDAESEAIESGDSTTASSNDTISETEPETSTSSLPEETVSETEPESTTSTPPEDTSSEDDPQPDKTVTLANPNTVLFESNGVKVTALDFGNQTNESYVTFDVLIENENDHDVHILLNSLTVNGYLISGMLENSTAKAGAEKTVSFLISKRDIEFAEIDVIREIIISFYAKDANFDMFILPTDPISLRTTQFDSPAPELDTSGVQVYNDKGILIVAKEELCTDNRYVMPKLLIKNSSDAKISVSCTKLLVNGKEISNFNCIRYGRVPSGIISYNSMDIDLSELETLGIEKVETIEMTLKVLSADFSLIAGDLTVKVNYE